nr:immunoglobulin heavy chain junction region [Macaca mulatta]MOX68579.1 immunoglobulin heavy chain junction region [Macaca mulatta]
CASADNGYPPYYFDNW